VLALRALSSPEYTTVVPAGRETPPGEGGGTVRLAVSSAGPDLDSLVDGRFGRCAYFVVVDTETLECEAAPNSAAAQASGAGIAAAQLLARCGAQGVVAAQLGPNAHQALSAGGMVLYQALGGTVRDNVQAHQEGRLPLLASATAAPHAGGGAGRGHGRGRRA